MISYIRYTETYIKYTALFLVVQRAMWRVAGAPPPAFFLLTNMLTLSETKPQSRRSMRRSPVYQESHHVDNAGTLPLSLALSPSRRTTSPSPNRCQAPRRHSWPPW